MTELYAVLADMAQRPQMYGITTLAELKFFVDGYRFGVAQGQSRDETPPFRQFSEWLVRKRERYCPSVLAAKREAFADFRIDESAWRIQQSV